MHMVAPKLGCKRAHGWDRVCHLSPWLHGQAYKDYWKTLNGCMTTNSANYCMLINEWVWLRSQVCLLRLEVDLGSVLESELVRKILGFPCVFMSRSRGAWEQG